MDRGIVVFSGEDFKTLQSSIEGIRSEVKRIPKKLESEILDTADLIQLLKVSARTVQKWRNNRLIRFSQVGSKIFYRWFDVLEFMERHSVECNNSI